MLGAMMLQTFIKNNLLRGVLSKYLEVGWKG